MSATVNRSRGSRRFAAVVAGVAVAGSLAVAPPTSAHSGHGGGPWASTGTNLYTNPTTSYGWLGSTLGTSHVTMYCWTSGGSSYGTRKWFGVRAVVRVNGKLYTRYGYMSANRVNDQITVGPCRYGWPN